MEQIINRLQSQGLDVEISQETRVLRDMEAMPYEEVFSCVTLLRSGEVVEVFKEGYGMSVAAYLAQVLQRGV